MNIKNIKKKLRFAAIFIICIISLQLLLACGDTDTGADQSGNDNNPVIPGGENSGDTPQAGENAEEYIFPELNCNGDDFTFLNMSTTWGFYTDLVHESLTGEVLDDAIFMRNLTIEETFNVNIKEIPIPVDNINRRFRDTVQAGDDIYDAAYIPCNVGSSTPIGALITSDLMHNLNNIPQLNIDREWWNQSILKDSVIGTSRSLYFLFGDINIFPLQAAYCIFINEDMISNLGLELPYNLVKEGKWTYDAMYEYMKAGAQLNGGAENFRWEADGPAIYGLTSFSGGALSLLLASGERGVEIDGDGMPYLTFETERFHNVVEKLGQMLATRSEGHYHTANNAAPHHFEQIFGNSRAVMMAGELKASDLYRDMEETYGIVPMPKYDESQSRYYVPLTVQGPVLTIPTTNNNTERAGIILDAMAYLSTKDVRPIFFDVTMSQKRLRNDESIEMLQIIRDSLFFDIGFAYGWTHNITSLIRDSLDAGGGGNVASTLEAQLPRSIANMETSMDIIESK